MTMKKDNYLELSASTPVMSMESSQVGVALFHSFKHTYVIMYIANSFDRPCYENKSKKKTTLTN